MTLSTLLAANLLLQTGSVPIWVPLAILLLIILLFWWGLTRNRIPEESAVAAESEAHEEDTADMEEEVDELPPPLPAGEEEADGEQARVIEDADRAPAVPVEAEEPPEADDLKIIEGIGPKIAGILADAGISTFAQLADTDPEQLDQIVREDAGIKIANPASWPEQASLAASGDLDGLEELQNRLVAGRHRS